VSDWHDNTAENRSIHAKLKTGETKVQRLEVDFDSEFPLLLSYKFGTSDRSRQESFQRRTSFQRQEFLKQQRLSHREK
jgi:hypothetical protein